MPDVDALVEGIRAGRRAAVSQAITLVESTNPEHREQARELLTELDTATRPTAVRVGISGVPGRREVDVHRGARLPAHRGRPPGRRARGRPVQRPHRRLGPRRQDPDGAALDRPERLHPALAERRHPRRRRPRDRAGDGGARGGGVRRGAGRDGRRGAVRGDRRRDGRHVPVPDPGPHRRPAPGHQEGHPRDRRRDRGEQGRRRPRSRRPARPPATWPARSGWSAARQEWAPPVVTCSALEDTGVDDVWEPGPRAPRAPRRRRAGRQARRSSSSTSPGRWSATSSTSGCGTRPA